MALAHPIPVSLDTSLSALTDEALMQAIGQGDQAAFTVLVGRHLGRVVSMAWRMSGNGADGEEIAQEAFARVWIHAPKWRQEEAGGAARFTTWLYRVVLNLAIDRKRRRGFSPLEEAGEIADEREDALGGLNRQQVAATVGQAVRVLPERQRMALVLCFYEELSNIEAAKVMNLSVGAIESLLIRAKKTLRHTLSSLRAAEES
jgi:RNA polymerase sigma-70 factor (ECF subfamily)